MRFPRPGTIRIAAAIILAGATLATATACSDTEPTSPATTVALSPVVVNTTETPSAGALASRLDPTKCIDASRATATTKGPTTLQPCTASATQQFTWQSNGTISTFGGRMCLDDSGGRGANMDTIIVYPCRNSPNQRWIRTSSGEIVGINGKCIDIAHAVATAGAAVILYTCHLGTNQQWDIKAATAPPSATTGLTLSKLSGDNQSAIYGAAVGSPLVVQARNAAGDAVPGATITWKGADGTPGAATTTTDASGRAQVKFTVSSLYFTSRATATAGTSTVTFTATGIGTPNLQGRRPFPAGNPWNTDISRSPVDPNSAALIGACGAGRQLHPDFGTVYRGVPNGIPFIVVHASQPKVSVTFRYASESDPGPYPLPPNVPIQATAGGAGDRHALVIDADSWTSYELFSLYPPASGTTTWKGGSGAIFNLTTGALRPAGWTSADAAGLPMFPGLVRYDEAAQRKLIQHALRMSCDKTRWAYVSPARHAAGDGTSPDLPPMGMRVRLKAGVDISKFSATNQVILRALKQYGVFVADDGVGFMISGAPDPRWSDGDLHQLTQITASNFEVVKMGPVTTVAH